MGILLSVKSPENPKTGPQLGFRIHVLSIAIFAEVQLSWLE